MSFAKIILFQQNKTNIKVLQKLDDKMNRNLNIKKKLHEL